jgi:hypothetical protein
MQANDMKSEKEIIEGLLGEKQIETKSDLSISRDYIEDSRERYEAIIAYFDENKPQEQATIRFLQYAVRMIEELDAMIEEIEGMIDEIMDIE